MTAQRVASRIDANVSPRSTALLRSLLLRELAAQTAQASDCRTTMNDLTGQTDVDSVLEREIAESSVVLLQSIAALVKLRCPRFSSRT